MLFYLPKFLQEIIYVKDLSIPPNIITVNKFYTGEQTNHYFGKKEDAYF